MRSTTACLAFLALLLVPARAQVNIGIVGTNSASNIATLLQGAGHTVTQYGGTLPNAGQLANHDTLFMLRISGNADIQNWVNNGGLLVTEWSTTTWVLNTANMLAATDSGGSCLASATPVTFVNPGTGLAAGVANPYSDPNRTHCFRSLTGIGAGVTIEANRPGPEPCILTGSYGLGFITIIGYDWADSFGSANGDTQQLILNAAEYRGGATCTLTAPAGVQTGDVDLTLDSASPVGNTVDASFEFSIDNGTTYTPCTAAGGSPIPNPAPGIPTGVQTFRWDSLADAVGQSAVAVGVLVRAEVTDALGTNRCVTAAFDVDNRQPPTCTVTVPAGIQVGDVELTLDAAAVNAAQVDTLFEYSLDSGNTYSTCTASPSSPLTNPALGVPLGVSLFTWDSHADGVAPGGVQAGVLVRATLDDQIVTGDCTTAPFDLDNSTFCNGNCGDCNQDQVQPNSILDALVAAQIGAQIIAPSNQQIGCCDVDGSTTVDILDALLIAQEAALVPVTLSCL